MERKPYPTDLTDEQWVVIEPFLPPAKREGRPREHDLREIVNALLYITQAGCAWRLLPHDFPPWRTVYEYFALWRDDRTLDWINARLREQVRVAAGRAEEPSIAVLDAQSVKTCSQRGPRGFDAGKKGQGKKAARPRRHARHAAGSLHHRS